MRSIIYTIAFISFFFTACKKTGDLNLVDLSPAAIVTPGISLTVTKDNAAADGVQYNEYLFKLTDPAKYNYTEVSFDISPVGKLGNGATTQKIPLDINGEARVFANSTTAGTVSLRATLGTYSKQISSQFQIAWPDQILVEPDSVFLAAAAGTKTNVRIRLLRSSGSVSNGLFVQLSDSTVVASPASVGIFLNTTSSNAAGIATTEYWLQNTGYHDYVYLKANIVAPAGIIRGLNRIRIRD
jgi:hypothetical protein